MKKKRIEYYIIWIEHTDEVHLANLCDQLDELAKEGWKPLGGVTFDGRDNMYMQTIMRVK